MTCLCWQPLRALTLLTSPRYSCKLMLRTAPPWRKSDSQPEEEGRQLPATTRRQQGGRTRSSPRCAVWGVLLPGCWLEAVGLLSPGVCVVMGSQASITLESAWVLRAQRWPGTWVQAWATQASSLLETSQSASVSSPSWRKRSCCPEKAVSTGTLGTRHCGVVKPACTASAPLALVPPSGREHEGGGCGEQSSRDPLLPAFPHFPLFEMQPRAG